MRRGRRALGWVGRLALVLIAVLVGGIAGLAALLGSARLSSSPAVFLGAGLVAFLLVTAVAVGLVTRGRSPHRRRSGRLTAAGIGAGLLLGLSVALMSPLGDPVLPPAPVPGQGFWSLSTGSRIAYVRLAAQGASRPTPVVFLHGGPGTPDMPGDSSYFGSLTEDGFDVYLYDQVGSGLSSRLPDPRQYTLGRHVADLEAIRQQIGARQMVLIGHSFGGLLAAAYLAAHPDRVLQVVFSSPEAPRPSTDGGNLVNRLDSGQRLRVYAEVAPPRPMLAYALLQVNPEAAHAFAGDREVDARFDVVYNLSRPSLHCHGEPAGPELHSLGFFSHQYPQSATTPAVPDLRGQLAGRATPALVIKGACDYLSWTSAQDYLRALPNARLVYLRGAGHNAYQDRPAEYLAVVRAFLTGQDLPIPASAAGPPPVDYEGLA